MESDRSAASTSRSKKTGAASAGQSASQGDSLLAMTRLRRRRQRLQAPFKMYSGVALHLIAGVEGSVGGNPKKDMVCSNPSLETLIDQGNVKSLPEGEGNIGGEKILALISSCLEAVVTTSNKVQTVAKHLFGSCSLHCDAGNGAGPSSRVGDSDNHINAANRLEPADGYEKRLKAVLTYLSKAELTDFTKVSTDRDVSKQISRSLHYSPSAKQEEATSFGKELVTHNEAGSLPERSSAAEPKEQTMTSNNAEAEGRISKFKSSCRVMILCMKSIVRILDLAIEAYRTAERAVEWVKTREFQLDEGVVVVVTDTASVASQCVSNALSEAEKAMTIHQEVVKGFEEVTRSSCNDQVIGHKDGNHAAVDPPAVADAAAAADCIGKLVQQTSNICLDLVDQDRAIDPTNAVQLCAQNDSSNGEVIPSAAYQTLMKATEIALNAMQAAAETVLVILSVSELLQTAKTVEH